MYTLGLSVTDIGGRTHIRLSASARPEPDSIARPDVEAWFTIIDAIGIDAPAFNSPRQQAVDVLGWAYSLIRGECAPDHAHSAACPCSLEAIHGRMTLAELSAAGGPARAAADAPAGAAGYQGGAEQTDRIQA